MTTPSNQPIAKEGGHWYFPDGSPFYTIIGKNGNERPVTLRDARPVKAVPSVTTVTGIIDKPGLKNWLIMQGIDAALTLPKLDGETLEDYKQRVISDAQEQSRKARDRGTELHDALELYLQGKPYDLQWEAHVNAVKDECRKHGIDLHDGQPERSFAHPLGFGGKCDWHNDSIVMDYKSKDAIDETTKLAWPEHAIQLAAYREGFKMPSARCINVFIGVDDRRVVLVEHDEADIALGWQQFKACLTLWKLMKGYDPVGAQ